MESSETNDNVTNNDDPYECHWYDSHIIGPLYISTLYDIYTNSPDPTRMNSCNTSPAERIYHGVLHELYLRTLPKVEPSDGFIFINEVARPILEDNPNISFNDFVKRYNYVYNNKYCTIVDDSYQDITDDYIYGIINASLEFKANVAVYDEHVRRILPDHVLGEPFTNREAARLKASLEWYDLTINDLIEYQDARSHDHCDGIVNNPYSVIDK